MRRSNSDRRTGNRPRRLSRLSVSIIRGWAWIPNRDYVVEIELWPTSVVIPAGYHLALTVLGRDFVFPGWRNAFASIAARVFGKLPLISALIMQGSAPFLHDERDRSRMGGVHRILCGGSNDSHILLPVIPYGRGMG